jgi:ergothioneine biosynthesis protein EgtB
MHAAPALLPAEQRLESLPRFYRQVRATTLQLAEPLSAEDQMVQASTECSPTKWHLAHTTWFFETFLLLHQPGYRPFDERFTYLFNSYYKQLDGHPLRTIRGACSRPSLQQVQQYREHVDEAMERLLSNATTEQSELAELGLNHEQQHQELILTDIKQAFWTNPLRPPYRAFLVGNTADASAQDWIDFESADCEIGHAGAGFSFDNEGPRHRVFVAPFRLASRLVTNAEYLAFMRAGGYRRPELWLSDGWDHICATGWRAPMYWEQSGDDWQTFTLAGMRQLVLSEPVCHVSYYEADAYARWVGARLPSEAEWEVAAETVAVSGNLLEAGRLHVAPAPAGRALQQMFGDVWEWAASPYVAYPRYQPATGVLGEYNGKFMCNQMVLRGGSCATPESHIRATYRNFFPPAARWQFMGIRLANDSD